MSEEKIGRQYCVDCGVFIGDVPYYMRKTQRFLCSVCRMRKLRSDNSYMRKVMAEIGDDYVEVA